MIWNAAGSDLQGAAFPLSLSAFHSAAGTGFLDLSPVSAATSGAFRETRSTAAGGTGPSPFAMTRVFTVLPASSSREVR
jgi:hypothetical protein